MNAGEDSFAGAMGRGGFREDSLGEHHTVSHSSAVAVCVQCGDLRRGAARAQTCFNPNQRARPRSLTNPASSTALPRNRITEQCESGGSTDCKRVNG